MCQNIVHPFETAGLGKAPFKFTGMSEQVCDGNNGAKGQPAGTCDYCCNGIKYCYHIQSSDGKKFIVGCDCVLKLGRADNRLIGEVEKAKRIFERDNRAAKRAVIVDRENNRIAAALALYDAPESYVRCVLGGRMHPCITGKTMVDYIEWMRHNAGHGGLVRIARIIEDVAKQTA